MNFSTKIEKWGMAAVVALALLAMPIALHAQATTTVADTIYAPDGSLPAGQIVISANSTFTAADGSVVLQGTVADVTVTNGAFSVALVPNIGATPSGTSYTALYELTGVPRYSETWIIPSSASSQDLAAVRAVSAPSVSLTFLMDQLTPPDNCISLGGLPLYTSGGWTCTTAAGTGTVTGFTATAANWPSWLAPTVTNATTTPSLAVAASAIPNAALANASTTVSGQSCTLGSSCTVPYSGLSGTPTLAQTIAAASHKWLNSYDSSTGLFTATQPDYSDLTGTPTAVQEQPAGTINGANVTFTTSHAPMAGTLKVDLNGLALREGASYDYTVSGTTITMNYAPKPGASFTCSYSY